MEKLKRHVLLVGLLLLGSLLQTFGQRFSLTLQGPEKDEFLRVSGLTADYENFEACRLALKEAQQNLIKQGYFATSIDSLTWTEKEATAYVILGSIYKWGRVTNQNIPPSFLNQLHVDEKSFFGKKIEMQKLIPLYEKIIRHFEDNGHPFVSLRLDSIRLNGVELNAQLRLDKGPLIKIDSIYLNEDAKISRAFLLRYLGLEDGMLYNESKLKAISARIRELPFLAELYPWRMSFTVVKSTLNLYIKTKSANRADALIGLLPNNAETQGKFLLTGDIKLAFMNALGRGERFQLNWQNLQFQSPRYNIEATYPYLFNSPFGLQGKFDFYKKDSTFKLVTGELGVVYQFNANDQLKLFYELSSNRIGTVNIPSLIASQRLPDNVDVTYRTFGIEGGLNRVDYRLNPRKGFRMSGKMGVSVRKILKNATIEETVNPANNQRFSYLYDTMTLNNYKYNFMGQIEYYYPLNKRLVLASIYHGGFSFANNALYRNELFQIGGYRLMRGFDEGSLYVNQYHVMTLEPRFLLSLNSYFFAFTDVGLVQSKFANAFNNNFLYSGGLGMTFETRAGLFNLSYALGGRDKEGVQVRNSKIHFGYINIF